jgi:hypothetical protein
MDRASLTLASTGPRPTHSCVNSPPPFKSAADTFVPGKVVPAEHTSRDEALQGGTLISLCEWDELQVRRHDVRVTGPHPERLSYGSFVSFEDPDGNGWLLQEVRKRLPGRVAGDTT